MNAVYGPNTLSIRRPSCAADAVFSLITTDRILISLTDPQTRQEAFTLAFFEASDYFASITFTVLPLNSPLNIAAGHIVANPNQLYNLKLYGLDYFDPLISDSVPTLSLNLHMTD